MVMVQVASSELAALVLVVKDEEQRLGYATKERLIDVAECIVNNYGRYAKEEYVAAIALLAKYRMANLTDHVRGKRLIAAEKTKAYIARCANCGLPISSRKSLETGLGVDCRKKLGVVGKKTEP